jgi:hypothetical protein
VFGEARGGRQGLGGSGHGRDGGKKTATPAMHKPARKSSPKGWVGWDKKKDLEEYRGFSEPYSKGLSDRNKGGGS